MGPSWWRLLAVVAVAAAAVGLALGAPADPYTVTWTTLLPESTATVVNTMPIGNGIIGANVFVDNTTTPGVPRVGALLASQGAFNEGGELIKVGWVYFEFEPPPPPGFALNQTLDVRTGTVSIQLDDLTVELYADATRPELVVVETRSARAVNVTVAVELVRTAPKKIRPVFDCSEYVVSADVVELRADNGTRCWYHRNAESPFLANTLLAEGLSDTLGGVRDTTKERTTGGDYFSNSSVPLVATGPLSAQTARAATSHLLGVLVVTTAVGDVRHWVDRVEDRVYLGIPPKAAHNAWWAARWGQSRIAVPSQPLITSQYVLQRYIQAVQARGPFPIKFNGMLFTANRPPNTDHRQWGGLNWWQNLRLPYYNMLYAGDGDLLASLLESFHGTLPLARLRTGVYFPAMEQPAAFWPEYTHPLYGTTHPQSYGCARPAGEPAWYSEDPWNHYNHQGGLDLSLMVLDHFVFTGNATALARYLPIADAVVNFFRQRWNATDAEGRLVFWPTQAVETWQCPGYPPPPAGDSCPANDMPTVAGLHAVLPRLLALPAALTTPAQRARWGAFHAVLPPIPINASSPDAPHAKLMPCAVCPNHTSNAENADLYAVHPYRLFGVGKPRLALATTAFATRRFRSDIGWNQNAMDAALLGLGAEAFAMVAARAATPPAAGYRFPVFAPHEQDYEPSADHFAVFANALTWMLLQPLDDANQTILLLPAWPCAHDVEFTLHGPLQTTVTASLAAGNLTFSVDPPSRRADVRPQPCQRN